MRFRQLSTPLFLLQYLTKRNQNKTSSLSSRLSLSLAQYNPGHLFPSSSHATHSRPHPLNPASLSFSLSCETTHPPLSRSLSLVFHHPRENPRPSPLPSPHQAATSSDRRSLPSPLPTASPRDFSFFFFRFFFFESPSHLRPKPQVPPSSSFNTRLSCLHLRPTRQLPPTASATSSSLRPRAHVPSPITTAHSLPLPSLSLAAPPCTAASTISSAAQPHSGLPLSSSLFGQNPVQPPAAAGEPPPPWPPTKTQLRSSSPRRSHLHPPFLPTLSLPLACERNTAAAVFLFVCFALDIRFARA